MTQVSEDNAKTPAAADERTPASAAKPQAPSVPKPSAIKAAPAAKTSEAGVVPTPTYQSDLAEAKKFAEVEGDGHVFLLDANERVSVGQYPNATEDEALAYFVRKYDDAVSQAMLLQTRIASGAVGSHVGEAIKHLRTLLEQRQMVGDMQKLRDSLDALDEQLTAEQTKAADKLAAAKEAKAAELEALVVQVEELAAKNPQGVQWKSATASMNELFEKWKAAHQDSVRLSRSAEDALWKRFKSARNTFEKNRRQFFHQLDEEHAEAKKIKEALIAEAEALSTSTDWGVTAGKYRDLMSRWKASKRAGRKDDDALWARFRGAQDTFFQARQAANDQLDKEFGENLKVKEELLVQAKQLLPVTDLEAAKKAFFAIADQWEAAGKVPRADLSRIESEFRAVEKSIRSKEQEQWEKSNPETQARANSMLAQLDEQLADLQAKLDKATAAKDSAQVKSLSAELETKKQWRAMVAGSA